MQCSGENSPLQQASSPAESVCARRNTSAVQRAEREGFSRQSGGATEEVRGPQEGRRSASLSTTRGVGFFPFCVAFEPFSLTLPLSWPFSPLLLLAFLVCFFPLCLRSSLSRHPCLSLSCVARAVQPHPRTGHSLLFFCFPSPSSPLAAFTPAVRAPPRAFVFHRINATGLARGVAPSSLSPFLSCPHTRLYVLSYPNLFPL